jgi:microcystin-dependent protein
MSSSTNASSASRRSWLKGLTGLLAGGLLTGRATPATARSGQSVASTEGLEPFLAEIMLVSFNFAPKGWALCNGQFLPINQNQALFALLGTTYGGDGQTTFALPDLRGRIPMHVGNGFTQGQRGGEETHILTSAETVPHTHGFQTSNAIGITSLSGSGGTVHHFLADNGGGSAQYGYSPNTALATTAPTGPVNTSSSIGGGQAHNNLQPFLCLNYIIALQGIFPSRN